MFRSPDNHHQGAFWSWLKSLVKMWVFKCGYAAAYVHSFCMSTCLSTQYNMGGPQGRSGRVRKISPPPGFDRVIDQYEILRNKPCGINKQAKNSEWISCIAFESKILHYKSIWRHQLLVCHVVVASSVLSLSVPNVSDLCKAQIRKWVLQFPPPFSQTVNIDWTIILRMLRLIKSWTDMHASRNCWSCNEKPTWCTTYS
jgi:hypothetical protein